MEEVFSKKWFIATMAGWVVLFILDELTYYWWKSLNPGSMYTGVLVKHPTQTPGTPTS
jgi:hypothetical protein